MLLRRYHDSKENKTNYSSLSFNELKVIAKEKGIKLDKTLKKADLIDLLEK